MKSVDVYDLWSRLVGLFGLVFSLFVWFFFVTTVNVAHPVLGDFLASCPEVYSHSKTLMSFCTDLTMKASEKYFWVEKTLFFTDNQKKKVYLSVLFLVS